MGRQKLHRRRSRWHKAGCRRNGCMDTRRPSATVPSFGDHSGREARRTTLRRAAKTRRRSKGARTGRQRLDFRFEPVAVSWILHGGQRERLWLWRVSHGVRIIYDCSNYETQFNIRCDSIFGLNVAISGSRNASISARQSGIILRRGPVAGAGHASHRQYQRVHG